MSRSNMRRLMHITMSATIPVTMVILLRTHIREGLDTCTLFVSLTENCSKYNARSMSNVSMTVHPRKKMSRQDIYLNIFEKRSNYSCYLSSFACVIRSQNELITTIADISFCLSMSDTITLSKYLGAARDCLACSQPSALFTQPISELDIDQSRNSQDPSTEWHLQFSCTDLPPPINQTISRRYRPANAVGPRTCVHAPGDNDTRRRRYRAMAD